MAHWWVPGLSIGFEHSFIHQVADFLISLDGKEPAEPTFEDAMKTERVVDAVLRSAKSGRWEKAS
jgi:myo-inositol 2-dehydrogenase/D-chiro-inositol 1-dehydrogenase